MDSDRALTPGGQQLAQQWADTQALMDACTRAVEEGNWQRLADQAGGLSVAADELATAASRVTTEATATGPADVIAAAAAMAHPPTDL
jgi:hypothetical protein